MGAKQHRWSPDEKLEVVRAFQKGAHVKDLESLFHVTGRSVYRWTKAYTRRGLDGLDGSSKYHRRPLRPKTIVAERILSQLPPDGLSVGRARAFLHRYAFINLARDTVRKILRRSGRPPLEVHSRRNKQPRCRRFEMTRPNQLWQADIMTFMLRGQYRLYIIGFIDDYSRFITGIGVYHSQTADQVLEVFRIMRRLGRGPLAWKFDHGSAFVSAEFQSLLAEHLIAPYPTRCRAPWTNGRCERAHRDLRAWLIPVERRPLGLAALRREVAAGSRMLNRARPRETLGYRTPGQVYAGLRGVRRIGRLKFLRELRERRDESGYRRAVRAALSR